MKTLYCGVIEDDDVMRKCQSTGYFTQHYQFLLGYNWDTNFSKFVSTNNDHFLNGVRIAVMDGKIKPEDIEILYLPDRGRSIVEEDNPLVRILIDKNGGLDSWPDGFFDEMDKSLNRLLG